GVPITSFWYSCGEDILAPRRQAIIHKIRNPKREIRNPKNSMPIVKSETSLFGTLCSFDHLELFRLSDFELRVFSAFLPINRKGRWLPRRINAAELYTRLSKPLSLFLGCRFSFGLTGIAAIHIVTALINFTQSFYLFGSPVPLSFANRVFDHVDGGVILIGG